MKRFYKYILSLFKKNIPDPCSFGAFCKAKVYIEKQPAILLCNICADVPLSKNHIIILANRIKDLEDKLK